MSETVSMTDAKSRLSELVNRASKGQERFRIEERGKPVGAIVSAEDLARLEEEVASAPRQGLLAAAGILADVEEWDDILEEIYRQRAALFPRPRTGHRELDDLNAVVAAPSSDVGVQDNHPTASQCSSATGSVGSSYL